VILSHALPCSCKSKEKEKEKKRNINNDLAVLPSHDIYPMLYFRRKFSSGITLVTCPSGMFYDHMTLSYDWIT